MLPIRTFRGTTRVAEKPTTTSQELRSPAIQRLSISCAVDSNHAREKAACRDAFELANSWSSPSGTQTFQNRLSIGASSGSPHCAINESSEFTDPAEAPVTCLSSDRCALARTHVRK